jgi:hypothetical protein
VAKAGRFEARHMRGAFFHLGFSSNSGALMGIEDQDHPRVDVFELEAGILPALNPPTNTFNAKVDSLGFFYEPLL